MPSLQEIVEKLSAAESDEMDEFELIDTLRLEFGMSEDEAQDMRNALEQRGFLQLRGTGRIILAVTHNEEAEYDALEAAAEEIEPISARVGKRDPENPHSTYDLEDAAVSGGVPMPSAEDVAGRTPLGSDAPDLEHLRDLSRTGRIVDIDASAESVVADPAADYTLDSEARVDGDEYYDEESLVLGATRVFEDEEAAPYSARPDDEPYEPHGAKED